MNRNLVPSCREIFNETVVVTRIIHVLTQASRFLALSFERHRKERLYPRVQARYTKTYFVSETDISRIVRQRARQIFPENLFRRSGYTHASRTDTIGRNRRTPRSLHLTLLVMRAGNTFLPSWLHVQTCR